MTADTAGGHPMEQVTVDAITVRRGDRVFLHGREWEVTDLRAVRGGRKRLVLDGGSTYLLGMSRGLPARRPV